jgi:hypothetical protein
LRQQQQHEQQDEAVADTLKENGMWDGMSFIFFEKSSGNRSQKERARTNDNRDNNSNSAGNRSGWKKAEAWNDAKRPVDSKLRIPFRQPVLVSNTRP